MKNWFASSHSLNQRISELIIEWSAANARTERKINSKWDMRHAAKCYLFDWVNVIHERKQINAASGRRLRSIIHSTQYISFLSFHEFLSACANCLNYFNKSFVAGVSRSSFIVKINLSLFLKYNKMIEMKSDSGSYNPLPLHSVSEFISIIQSLHLNASGNKLC